MPAVAKGKGCVRPFREKAITVYPESTKLQTTSVAESASANPTTTKTSGEVVVINRTISTHPSLPLADRVDPQQGKHPAGVVTKLDAVFHEDMLPQQQCERQHQ